MKNIKHIPILAWLAIALLFLSSSLSTAHAAEYRTLPGTFVKDGVEWPIMTMYLVKEGDGENWYTMNRNGKEWVHNLPDGRYRAVYYFNEKTMEDGAFDEQFILVKDGVPSLLGSLEANAYASRKSLQVSDIQPQITSGSLSDTAIPLQMRADVFGSIERENQAIMYKMDIATGGVVFLLTETQPVDPSQNATIPGNLYKTTMLDGNGSVVAASNATDLAHASMFVPVSAGTYFIKTEGTGIIDTRFKYKLRADGSATIVVKDSYESNDQPDEAKVLGEKSITANLHAPDDVDYYSFELSEEANAVVTLTNIPAGHIYELEVLDSNLSSIERLASDGSAYVTFQKILPKGTHYVKVSSPSGSSSSQLFYQLSKSIGPSSGPQESNTSMSTSATYYLWQSMYGQIDRKDEQHYYKMEIGVGGKLFLSLSTAQVDPRSQVPQLPGYLYNMELLNDQGTLVAPAKQDVTDLSIITTVAPGTYYVRVEGTGLLDTRFQYKFGAVGDVIFAGGDPYEDNGSPEKAKRLEKESVAAKISNSADEDTFFFELAEKASVTLQLSDIPSGHNYDAIVMNGDLATVASFVSNGNTAEAGQLQLPSGKYYVKVYAAKPFAELYVKPYTLKKEVNHLVASFDVTVTTPGYGTLSGKFKNSQGVLIQEGQVKLHKKTEPDRAIYRSIKDGRLLTPLPEGDYALDEVIDRASRQAFTVGGELRIAGLTQLLYTLPDDNVAGQITMDGRPLASAEILIRPSERLDDNDSTSRGLIQDGHVSMYLPAGDYQVIGVFIENRFITYKKEISVPPTGQVDLSFNLPVSKQSKQ